MTDRNTPGSVYPFLRFNFATLWVRDAERSRRFFVDQLGFQTIVDVKEETPIPRRWIVVAPALPEWLGEATVVGLPGIALVVPGEGSPEREFIGRNTGLGFITNDVEATFRGWSQNGVRFREEPATPAWGSGRARHAIFEDPDGNSFSLIEFDEATRIVESERLADAAKRKAERTAAQELEIAKNVQSRLFPQAMPTQTTLTYAGVCVQAREVGGDYFDFLDLGKQRLGLLIADIAGKGIAGALLMANLQANLRSQSALASNEPRQMMRSLNQLFFSNTAPSAYSTLFFAEYDDRTGRLRYANCGHLPALLLHADDKVELLSATATVLGLFEEWDCTIEDCQLAPGDILVLYTDGITEAVRNDDPEQEEFGEARLIESILRHRNLPPDDLLSAILNEIGAWSGNRQHDDITLIVAKCHAGS